MKNKEQVCQFFEPVLNQILFGTSDAIVLNSDKLRLSNEFSNVLLNTQDNTSSKDIENFIESQINIVFKDLDILQRSHLAKTILDEEVFVNSIIFISLFQQNRKSNFNVELAVKHFESEIENYIITGNMNYYISAYFNLIFEELFYFEFSDLYFISEKEYLILKKRYTNIKSIGNYLF